MQNPFMLLEIIECQNIGKCSVMKMEDHLCNVACQSS